MPTFTARTMPHEPEAREVAAPTPEVARRARGTPRLGGLRTSSPVRAYPRKCYVSAPGVHRKCDTSRSRLEAMVEGLAELHTHLGGSVASDILWSLAHEQGIALPLKDYWE